MVVIAGAVVIAVVVAALGIGGADGTRPHTPGRRIDRLVVVADTVVLAVAIATLGIRGARRARHAARATAAASHTAGAAHAAGIVVGVIAAGRNLHQGEGQGQRTED